LHAVIQLADGDLSPSAIDVFVTHLQAGPHNTIRFRQVDQLTRFIQRTRTYCPETPILLMGDFNINGDKSDSDDNGEDGDVRSQYSLLNATLRQAIPTLSDVWPYHQPAQPGFTNAKRKKRIDYIFLTEGPEMWSRTIEVNEFPVATPLNLSEPAPKQQVAGTEEDKETLSDHAGVEARIVWVPRASITRLSRGS
jgi:endonuclease/exonuclease/phosphatase family metal-dependent hydrolase